MSTSTTQPDTNVKFRPHLEHRQNAARGRVLRLADRRSQAWRTGDAYGVRNLTGELEAAWNDLRSLRATTTPYRPPAAYRRTGMFTVDDLRYRNAEYVLDRFLLDCCTDDDNGVIELADFARRLGEYVTDIEERRDLPSNRELARQLRERGISTLRRGGVVWVTGLRLIEPDEQQDETRYSPLGHSHSNYQQSRQ